KHQGEMVRFAGVAAASSAYFITLWILAQPIASRSLLTPTTLPSAPAARSALLDARLTVPVEAPSPRPQRARATLASATIELAALREPVGDAVRRAAVPAAPGTRRRAGRSLRLPAGPTGSRAGHQDLAIPCAEDTSAPAES